MDAHARGFLRLTCSLFQGVDDAFALILAVAAGMSIEGVTIVHGNGACVKSLGINAKCCLRVAGADPSVQVYLGSSFPIESVKLDDSTLKGVHVRDCQSSYRYRNCHPSVLQPAPHSS